MSWLASFFTMLAEKLLPVFMGWIGAFFKKLYDSWREKQDEKNYDQDVKTAMLAYKAAQPGEETESAFKNLIFTIRRH